MRQHALAAVSTLQLLLISKRGHRAYTRRELDIIYLDVGKEFFRNLEAIREYLETERIRRGTEAHERRPTRVNPPLPFKRARRCCDAFGLLKPVFGLFKTCIWSIETRIWTMKTRIWVVKTRIWFFKNPHLGF